MLSELKEWIVILIVVAVVGSLYYGKDKTGKVIGQVESNAKEYINAAADKLDEYAKESSTEADKLKDCAKEVTAVSDIDSSEAVTLLARNYAKYCHKIFEYQVSCIKETKDGKVRHVCSTKIKSRR